MPVKSMPPYSRSKGFTLIELLVVIGIISLLFAVAANSIAAIQKNSRDAKRQADLRQIQSALQHYYSDNNFYPASLPVPGQSLDNCFSIPSCTTVSPKIYLESMPTDPASGTAYLYRSLTSPSSTQTCNYASSPSVKCHFYVLCAKSENLGKTSTRCNALSAGYDIEITP